MATGARQGPAGRACGVARLPEHQLHPQSHRQYGLHDTAEACVHRFFLDNVAGWILELDRGQGIPFEGNYSQWLEARARRMAGERKQQAGLQRAIDDELEFVRSKAKGQQKKGKARMRRYDELVSKVSASIADSCSRKVTPAQLRSAHGLRRSLPRKEGLSCIHYV